MGKMKWLCVAPAACLVPGSVGWAAPDKEKAVAARESPFDLPYGGS